MKKLRNCYNQLSPADAKTLSDLFKEHFNCSKHTFYRVLDDENPSLKYVRWFSENAGFHYNTKDNAFEIDTQFLIQNPILKKLGLSLVS